MKNSHYIVQTCEHYDNDCLRWFFFVSVRAAIQMQERQKKYPFEDAEPINFRPLHKRVYVYVQVFCVGKYLLLYE